MKRSTKVFLFTVGLLGLSQLAGCKQDNSFKTNLAASALTRSFAKYLKIASNYTTKASGASSPVITSSQAFDTGYWGWNDSTGYLSNSTTLVLHHDFAQPLPTEQYQQSFLVPFGDGTWPNNYVSTGVIRPKEITDYSYTTFDTANTETTPTQPNTYVVQYDLQTGFVKSAVETVYDTSGVIATKTVYKFAEDPRGYSEYYNAGYSVYTGAAQDLSGSTVTNIEVSTSGTSSLETYTYKNFNAAGTLADFTPNTFGSKNGSVVLKKVVTVGVYQDASTDISSNSVVTTTTDYVNDTVAVFKDVQTVVYNNLTNRLPQSSIAATYTVASGVETLASKTVTTYADGFEATRVEYAVAAGVPTALITTETTRNTKGRPTQVVKKNATSVIYYQEDYTYDSSDRLSTFRVLNVAADGGLTCAAGSYDMSYQVTTSVAGATINFVTKADYPCATTVLSADPTGKVTTGYNAEFLPVSVQTYTYTAGTFVLTAQTGYTYNTSNRRTRQQDYTVVQEIATAGAYIDYTYDTNGFLVSQIGYTVAGMPSAAYTVYNFTYK